MFSMVEPGFSFLAPEIHKEFILRKCLTPTEFLQVSGHAFLDN